jgi:uncharacterized protein YqiB (DUF1249 family)
LVALGVVGCERAKDDAAWWERESERIRLAGQLELAEFRQVRAAGAAASVAELAREREARSERAVALEAALALRADLAMRVAALEAELAHFQAVSVEQRRQRMVGMSYPELVVATGRVYQDVSVAAVSDAGVVIRHRDGSARLGYTALTEEQREWFAMSHEAARAAEEREREMALAYESALDRQLASIEREQRQRSVELSDRERRESDARRASAAMSASATTARAGSALSQPARALGSGTPSRYRLYRDSIYRDRARYGTYYFVCPSRQVSPVSGASLLNAFSNFSPSPRVTRPAATCPPNVSLVP